MGIVKFYLDLNVTGSSTAIPSIPTLDERPTFFSSDNVILEINLTESQARIFQFKTKNDTTDWDDTASNDLMFRYTPADNSDYEHNINTDRPKNWPVFLNHWHNWQDKKHQKLHTASERLDKALANRIAYKVFNAPIAYDIFDNERVIANQCGMAVNNALKQIREKIGSGYTALGNASGSDRGTHDNIFSANFSSVDQEGQDNDNNIPEYLLSRILKSEPLRVNKTNLLNPSTLNSNYGAVSCMDATEKYSEWTDVPLCAGDEIFINMNAKVTFTNPLTNASIDIDTTLANNANTSYIQPDSTLADASANKAVIKINIVKNDANDTANHAKISDFDLKDNEDDFNGHSSSTYYKEGDSSYVGPYSSVPENPTDASGNKMVFRSKRAAQQYTDSTGSNNGVDTTEVVFTTIPLTRNSTYHAPNAYTAANFHSYEHLDNIGALDEEKPTFTTLTFQGAAAEHADYNGASNVDTTALINVVNNSVNFNIVFDEPLDPNTQFKDIFYVGATPFAQLSSLIGGDSTIHSEVSSDGGITWTGTITPANDTTIIDQAIVIRNFQDLAGNVGDDIESTAKITIDTASPYATLAVVNGSGGDLLTHNGMSLYNINNKEHTQIRYSMHNIEQDASLNFTLYEKVNDNWVSRGTNTTNTNSSTNATNYHYINFTDMQFDSSVSALVNDTDDTEWKLTVEATDVPGRNQLVTTNGNKEFIFKTDFTEPGIHTNTFESILKEFGGVKYLNTATSSSFSYNVESNSSDLNFSECKVEILTLQNNVAYTHLLTTSSLETIDQTDLNLNGLVDGTSYTHKLTYTDNAGNVTEQVSNTFTVDKTSANITGVALAEVIDQSSNKIQVTFNDTLDNATVNASDFDITNDALSNYSVSSVAHTTGTNSLVLTIDKRVTTDCTISYTSGGLTDKAGNPTDSQTINLQTDTFNHTGITLDDNNHQLTIPVLINDPQHEIKLVGDNVDDTFQALDNFTINYTLKNDDTGTLNATQISRNGASNELKLQLPSTVSNNGTTYNVNSADIKQLDIDFSALAGINRVLKNNTDGVNNQVTDVIQYTVSDTTRPTVEISALDVNSGVTTNDNSITLVFEITEANTHTFDLSAITLKIDGAVANARQYISEPALLSSSDTVDVYHATLSKDDANVTNNAVEFSVSVAANAFDDDDSNGNEVSVVMATMENEFKWTCNQIRPTITITANNNTVSSGSHTNDNTLNLKFTVNFNGEVNDLSNTFALEDITVSNAVVDTFEKTEGVNNTEYTAVLKNPSAVDGTSTATVSINENVANDLYGNTNVASASFEWNCDQVNPTITSSAKNSSNVNVALNSTINVRDIVLTYVTEPRVEDNFVEGDLELTNCTIQSFSNNGDGTYTVEVSAFDDVTQQLNCAVKLPVGAIQDKAGNTNLGANEFTWVVDRVQPTVSNVTIAQSTNTYLKEGDKLNITLDFSPDIANKVLNITDYPTLELSLDNGVTRDVSFASSNGMNAVFEYTVQSGDNTSQLNYVDVDSLKLSGGTIKDNYGNDASLNLIATNSANNDLNTKTIIVDTISPAQGTIDVSGHTNLRALPVTIQGFTDANNNNTVLLQLNGIDISDVDIDGNGDGSHTLTTANLSGLSDDQQTIRVIATDKANNVTQVDKTFEFNNTAPTLTLGAIASFINVNLTNPEISVESNRTGTLSISKNGTSADETYTISNNNYASASTSQTIEIQKNGGGSLSDGLHNITIAIQDVYGNITDKNISFTVVTSSPDISSVELSWGANDILNSHEVTNAANEFVKVTVVDPLNALNGTTPVLDLCGNTLVSNINMNNLSTEGDSETSQSINDNEVKAFINEIANSTGNTYKVTVTVTDRAGNSSSQDKTFTVNAVAAILNAPATVKTNANDTVSFNISANETGTLSVSTDNYEVSAGADYVNVGNNHSVTVHKQNGNFATGSNIIDLVLTDTDGNETTQQVEIDVSRTAPTVTSPTDNTVFTNGVLTLSDISGGEIIIATLSSANADGKNATLTISGETINSAISGTSVSFTVSKNILAGISEGPTHTLTITPEEDNYGNASQPKDITFTVDKTAPSFDISSISWGTGANEIMIVDDLTTNDTVITFNNIVSDNSSGDMIEFMTPTYNLINVGGLGDAWGEVGTVQINKQSSVTMTIPHTEFNDNFDASQVVFKFRGKDVPHGHTSSEISRTYTFDRSTTDIKPLVADISNLHGANLTATITIEVNDGDELVEDLSSSDIIVSTTSYGNIDNFTTVTPYKKYTIDFEANENVSNQNVTVSVPSKAIRKKIRVNSSNVRQGNLSDSAEQSIVLHIDNVGPAPVSAVVDASGYNVSITFDETLYDIGTTDAGAMINPKDFVVYTLVNGMYTISDNAVNNQIHLEYINDNKTVLVTLRSPEQQLTNDMSNVYINYMATTAVDDGRQPLRDVNGNHVENTRIKIDVTAAPAPDSNTDSGSGNTDSGSGNTDIIESAEIVSDISNTISIVFNNNDMSSNDLNATKSQLMLQDSNGNDISNPESISLSHSTLTISNDNWSINDSTTNYKISYTKNDTNTSGNIKTNDGTGFEDIHSFEVVLNNNQ